jgi:hypothetical protein
MKHKVKKFGRGGDILTGLGAGLLGYAAYKKLTEGKDKDKDDDYTRRVKEFGRKGDFPEAQKEEKAKPKREEYVAADKEENEAKKSALSRGMQYKKPEGPAAQERKITPKKAPSRPAASTSTSKSPTPPADNATLKSKPYPAAGKPSEERPSKTSPATVKQAMNKPVDTSVPKGIDLKGTNKTVYGTDTTSVFQKRAAKEREEKAKAEAEAEKKRRSRPSSEEMMTQSLGGGFKRGGTIKKYAAGGTTTSKPEPKKAPMPAFAREAKENRMRDERVKKEREAFDKYDKTRLKDQGSFKKGGMTASKRGDGIAMRGKTKGKMY